MQPKVIRTDLPTPDAGYAIVNGRLVVVVDNRVTETGGLYAVDLAVTLARLRGVIGDEYDEGLGI